VTAICPISGSGSSPAYCQHFCLSKLCLLNIHSSLPHPHSLVYSVHPALLCCMSFPVPCLLSSFVLFCFCGVGVSLSRGLCWFIPGVAVGILCAAYLLTCWSVSPKQVWSWHLMAWEPSCFLSVTWCGEALYGLGVQGVRDLLFLGDFFSARVDPVSQQDF
jgi:hypothetical protein